MMFKLVAVALAAVLMGGTAAGAAEFTVNMVNKDVEGHVMQFEPAFLKVMPGDVVHFVAVDKGHDTEAIALAVPEGAELWKGKLSQDVTVTLTVEGLYVFKCLPHVGLGMVGLIEVGDNPTNVEAVKALQLPKKSRARLDELLAQAVPGA